MPRGRVGIFELVGRNQSTKSRQRFARTLHLPPARYRTPGFARCASAGKARAASRPGKPAGALAVLESKTVGGIVGWVRREAP